MENIESAVRLLESGAFAEAERICEGILAGASRDVPALSVLGIARHGRGDYGRAAAAFRQLTEIEPASPDHWANLGTALRSAGEFDPALEAYRQAVQRGAGSAEFLLNLALLHVDRLEHGRARVVLAQAAAEAPRNAEIRYLQALCGYEEVRTQDAQEALRSWRDFEGLTPDVLIRVGTLLLQLGETAEAESALRGALQLEPGSALAHVRLAQLLERNNRVEEARKELAAIPASAPDQGGELAEDRLTAEARLAERDKDLPQARLLYQRLLAATRQPHLRYHVLFPLARVLDGLGDYEEAMATLVRAHDSQVNYLRKTAARFMDPGQRGFNITRFSADPADVARWNPDGAPDATRSPIFIVGFPRSGTTLLEQALDAHPLLRSMDEQPFLQNAIDRIRSFGVTYPEQMSGLTEPQCREVREEYWRLVSTKAKLADGQRLVDKNPLNMLRLPAIRRLFPASPIILAVRHPCDVLISNYMQHYRAPEIAAMCQSLPSLAEGYRRTFDFWYQQQGLLAANVLELQYEKFVDDFDAGIRGVTGFVQVPWDDAVLRPGDHARQRGYISTPSYSQVVEPVNRKAVGRWHRYEKHLRPVLPVLEPYLRRWGYEG